MIARLTAVLALVATTAGAVEFETRPLEELKWIARPFVIFADSPADPRVALQLERIEDRLDELADRDVVILLDTDPAARSELRQKFHPRDFAIIVLGKDGEVKYRKPTPVTVREVIRLIDRTPLRRQEIETRNERPPQG